MKLKILIGNCNRCNKEFKFPELQDGYARYPNDKMSINCPFCQKGKIGNIRVHQEVEVEKKRDQIIKEKKYENN